MSFQTYWWQAILKEKCCQVALAPQRGYAVAAGERPDRPIWTHADAHAGWRASLFASEAFRYVAHFLADSAVIASPVLSTNMPYVHRRAQQGLDSGLIVL